MAVRRKHIEKSQKAKQSAKLAGNQNARRSVHGGKVIRLSGSDTDLLHDFFALEGNIDPSNADFNDAIHYALTQVYGRKIEDQQAYIL